MNNNKQIILVIGIAAIALALLLYIAFLPSEEEIIQESPYVMQIEEEAKRDAALIDSLNMVVEGLNVRIDSVRTQMDSSRTSNKVLLTTLHRLNNEMKEYRRLTTTLRGDLEQVAAARDSLRNSLFEQTNRLQRVTEALEKAHNDLQATREDLKVTQEDLKVTQEDLKDAEEIISSVLVYIGIEDNLKEQGYLHTWRRIRKNYKIINFPDVDNTDVKKVAIGENITVQGELAAVCDDHGKLSKDKEYALSEDKAAQTVTISFSDPLLVGQRILIVLKN
ncbi:MAG: hypothetical protein F4Y39_13070 [Gemmatimonadetes bacterium]|nr:hypothetical protein [Gemmatimonadota bacterium]MYF72057.1 hypothetical protein [Gemmatimonadota bacterium]MYK51754.1 hypothetical protein [Gemmatimonadota bacterium]